VREFVQKVGARLGMQIEWRGQGVEEQGLDTVTGRTVVKVDPRYFRPAEVDSLLGDPSAAREKLGWKTEISFDELVREMVDHDLKDAQRDALMAREGFKVFQYNE